jgi:peptide/nickel transport system permease protein
MNNETTNTQPLGGSSLTAVEIPGLGPVPTPFPSDETGFDTADTVDIQGRLSYRQLIWRRFCRNKLAAIGGIVLVTFYFVALFAEFFAPYDYTADNIRLRYVPPQQIHMLDTDNRWHLPFVYGLTQTRDPVTEEITFAQDTGRRYPIGLFRQGFPYRLLGIFPTDIHLFGSDGPLFLVGTDRVGHDFLSRIVFGSRVSLTIGLVGVFFSIVLGALLGTASGYFGGTVDNVIQRMIEIISSFPSIPLWMALATALPSTWNSVQVYFAITVILSLISWGGLARQIRGKVLASRELDYVLAARSVGANDWYILTRHLMPNAYSHIIVIATLCIPGMILGETALSFLGLGIRPPMTSWGVLLEEAQRVTVVLNYPWLLTAAVPVLIVVIAFNFVGDALRDAADPYS